MASRELWGGVFRGTPLDESLYLFSPFGLAILVPTLLIAWMLPSHDGHRSPEIWGLLAGPGLF